MGYTHYFTQKKDADVGQWNQITKHFKQLMTFALIDKPLLIQRESDNGNPPCVDTNMIAFNGRGDNGHETMVLERCGSGFQFCKTARKPYDTAVIALLCLANHYAPDVWGIGSDGDKEEWADGLALARTVEPAATLPPELK